METATQACLALGIPEVHVCWDLSEALLRIRDAPKGPLCEWLGLGQGPPTSASAVGQGPPAAAASLCAAGQESPRAGAASLCEMGEMGTRSRDDGGVSSAAEEWALPVKARGLEWLLASEGPEERSWSPGDVEPGRGGAAEAQSRGDAGAPLCRCRLPCAANIMNPPAAGDAACLALQQQQQQQHQILPPRGPGDGETLTLTVQRPPLFTHCCPRSPEAAERAYERYGRALADLADAAPADETILCITHGE